VKRAALLAAALLLAACEREQREFRASPKPAETPAGDARARAAIGEEFQSNAYHMSQGKKLYAWLNCNGCHGNGGGAMGPALMDEHWIYGGEPEQIFETIRDGRPNGMPSFRGRIPDTQIWQLVAYVRAMGRHVRKDAAPSRADDLHPGKSETARPRRDAPDDGESP
jgi:cytochrome c oxidase cbb3-type subunit 3